jgi:hypothetical protein
VESLDSNSATTIISNAKQETQMGQTQVIRNGPADIIMTDYAKNVEIVNKPDPKWRRKSRIPDDGDPVIPFCALRYFTFVRVC